MDLSLRLSEEAVTGSYSISPEALQALRAGDTAALLASHRARFGGWKMEDDDDADEEDEEDESEDDESDEDSENDEGDEESPEGKKSKKADDTKQDDSPAGLKRKVAALEDEKNRLYRGRQRARQERDDALAEIERLKKDGQGDETLKQQIATLESENKNLKKDVQGARLANAFLADNTYEWVNPSQALKLADLSDVEFDDDGKVHGLKSALEALANSSPHLLKPKRQPRQPAKAGGTGTPPAKKAAKNEKAREAAIADKYRIRR